MAKALLAMAVVTLLWAVNFTAGRIATRELDPLLVAALRVLVSAGVLYGALPRADRRLPADGRMLLLGLALTGIVVNHVCFAAGIRLTSPSHASVIHALIPVFVGVFAWALLRERLGPLAIAGMAIAVAGAVVVVAGGTRDDRRATIEGDLLIVAGVTAFSVYMVLGRRIVERMGSRRALALAFAFGTPFMLPVLVAGCLRQDWSAPTWRGWCALAYMIVAANLVCYSLHLFALTRLKAGQVAAFVDLQPALAVLVAVVAGEDDIHAVVAAGGLLALLGVALVQVRRD